MPQKTTKADLSIYLAKSAVGTASQIVKGVTRLKSFPLRVGTEEIGTLFIKDAHLNPPRWAKFFKQVIPEAEFGRNSSTAAVLVVPANKRIFMLTFGQGRHLIDSEFIEMNFGLRVALNSLDANSLRSIDKSSFETYPKQSPSNQGSRRASILRRRCGTRSTARSDWNAERQVAGQTVIRNGFSEA